AVPDFHVMLDNRERPDAHVVSDSVRFTDVHLVSGLKVSPDDVARVDHRMRPDDGVVTDASLEFSFTCAARRRPDNTEVFDNRVVSENDVVEESVSAHDASPSLQRRGRKRSWTSLSVSIDTYRAVINSRDLRPSRPSTSAAFFV